MQDNPKSYCSRAQFAERFHVPLGAGAKLMRTGKIEIFRAGKFIRIGHETIDRFVRHQQGDTQCSGNPYSDPMPTESGDKADGEVQNDSNH